MSVQPITFAAVKHAATIRVWPDAGQLLGLGRDAAYRAAERGEIPTLKLGRRLVVPVPRLLAMLGAGEALQNDEAAPDAPGDRFRQVSPPENLNRRGDSTP